MSDAPLILVTGGASGIGHAIVEAIVAQGWRAVIADLPGSRLDQAGAGFATADVAVSLLPLDVADEDAVVAAIARCEAEIGPLAGIVNSAGIGRDVPALDTSAELFRTILGINLIGSFLVAREAARHMRARGAGSIVNIASVSGLKGNRGRVAYGASKGGVVTMTQVLAVEFAALGIRVNAIAPGPIETPLVAAMHSPESRALWLNTVPQRRYAAPSEIAGTAMFLLDGRCSSFVTGQTIAVDGGFSIAGLIGPPAAGG